MAAALPVNEPPLAVQSLGNSVHRANYDVPPTLKGIAGAAPARASTYHVSASAAAPSASRPALALARVRRTAPSGRDIRCRSRGLSATAVSETSVLRSLWMGCPARRRRRRR